MAFLDGRRAFEPLGTVRVADLREGGFSVLGRPNDFAQLGRSVSDVSQKVGKLADLDCGGFDLRPFIHPPRSTINGCALSCVSDDVRGGLVPLEG